MSAAAFPRHVFPLTDDPAFDALDFGVSGRLLVKGGAFALQNAEGLALDLAAAGPGTDSNSHHVEDGYGDSWPHLAAAFGDGFSANR